MATIVLQAAGAFVGGLLGPVGSAIGSALGALAGYTLDRAIIDSTRRIEGPRLSGARPFTAEEGAPIPRIYGSARVSGTMIWATRFQEVRTTQRQGGKMGPKVTEYTYFGNAAFALCEGAIAGIRRVWADGREIDRSTLDMRIYHGGEDQEADPLISAKQGASNTPAYRGIAYVVIERFALADYGNRIPQFQFEVLRPVGNAGKNIRAISLIPGATEYGLSSSLVTRQKRPGETEALNRHVLHDATDLGASLDELQAYCPNLEHVALVVAWFGDDLRAGACKIRPGVTTHNGAGLSKAWKVSGIGRADAKLLSMHEGGSAYGGTPSDASVIEAIQEIKARGLKVTLYPFIMMDVPVDNDLPDPYGGTAQAAYPWRGRITAHPAPLQPGSPDGSAGVRAQIEAFCGEAEVGDFTPAGGSIDFGGDDDDWGYSRFVLHNARLAAAAGGVDAFLIGSEMRGLTTLRDDEDAFPFVETLCDLAADVRTTVGPATRITYGADWSEYFGHHPADGTGDVFFHLDPLWAHPEIDAVGIDNYMPLSDWRDADYRSGNPDGFAGPYDPEGLRAAIAGGEGFDWHYADFAARAARERAPITDGLAGKPWVFRYKDLVNWWSQPHHDRIGGVEAETPTDWAPGSKPFWFTELGCPAVDKGPNQPNVFSDPKSAEGMLPYFSSGGRADIAQTRFLEAHAAHWDEDHPGFDEAGNPESTIYDGRMVDASRTYVWAWDARPFPAFPLRADEWSDHGNWHGGHWLNGRLGNPGVGDLINAILADHGLPPATVDGVDGTVHGYVIDSPTSARAALEPITGLLGLAVLETPNGLAFQGEGTQSSTPLAVDELVSDGENPVVERTRTPDHQLPVEAVLNFQDPMAQYQMASVRNARFWAQGSRQQTIGFPGVMETGQGRALISDWMRRVWSERDSVRFSVPAARPDIVPGAIIRLPSLDDEDYLVTQIEDGLFRSVLAKKVQRTSPTPWRPEAAAIAATPHVTVGQPRALFLDLPAGASTGTPQDQFRVVAWQKPWKSQAVFASPEETGFVQRTTIPQPANIGMLVEALPSGVSGRVDRSAAIVVELFGGEAASVSRAQLLNGANAVAIRSVSGTWEIVQFGTAEEIAPDIWRMTSLLRGQLGTDDAMHAGAAEGASLVLMDDAARPAGLLASEAGLELTWRVGPAGSDFSEANFTSATVAGGLRALLPLSPVHIKCTAGSGGLALSWIRRGRIDADSWTPSEIPLGEEREEYRIDIAPVDGPPVRTQTVLEPNFLYGAAAMVADFGAPPAAIDVTVRQLSVAVGFGVPARRRFALS